MHHLGGTHGRIAGKAARSTTADDEVCVRVTDDFLRFSEGAGNDLRTLPVLYASSGERQRPSLPEQST